MDSCGKNLRGVQEETHHWLNLQPLGLGGLRMPVVLNSRSQTLKPPGLVFSIEFGKALESSALGIA